MLLSEDAHHLRVQRAVGEDDDRTYERIASPEYKGRTGLHDQGYLGQVLEGTSSRVCGQHVDCSPRSNPTSSGTVGAISCRNVLARRQLFLERLWALPHGEQDGMRSRRLGCEVLAVRMKQQAMVLTG